MYYDDDYYYQADREEERYNQYLDQEYERNQSWEWQEREDRLNWYEEEQSRQYDQDSYSPTSSWGNEDSWSWSSDEGRSSGGSSRYSGSGAGYTSTGSYGRSTPRGTGMSALCMMLLALLAAFLWMLGSKVTLAAAELLPQPVPGHRGSFPFCRKWRRAGGLHRGGLEMDKKYRGNCRGRQFPRGGAPGRQFHGQTSPGYL